MIPYPAYPDVTLFKTDKNMFKVSVLALWAPDVETTARFYQQAIGLPLHFEQHHVPHFQLDEAVLVILKGTPKPAQNAVPERFPLFALKVPNLEEAIERLNQYEVPLPWGIESNALQRWVMFLDPAGNLVELVESTEG